AAADEFIAEGYDYLKIYDDLSKEAYDVFVAASRVSGVPLDGHIPAAVGLSGVLAAHQNIQHLDKIAYALSQHSMATTKLGDLTSMFSGKRMWVTPTLASLRAMDIARTVTYAEWLARPEMAYVDSGSIGWWKSLSGTQAAREP